MQTVQERLQSLVVTAAVLTSFSGTFSFDGMSKLCNETPLHDERAQLTLMDQDLSCCCDYSYGSL